MRTHYATVTDPAVVGALLRAIEGYHGGVVVKNALRLLPLVFLRPGELRKAEWSEFNLDAGIWNVSGEPQVCLAQILFYPQQVDPWWLTGTYSGSATGSCS